MSLVSEAGSKRSSSDCAASACPESVSSRYQARAATGGGVRAWARAAIGRATRSRRASGRVMERRLSGLRG